MKSLAFRNGTRFLFAFLLVQAVGARQQQAPGFVTGVVRSDAGATVAGVRVYAISVRDASEAAGNPAPLESQAQTDTAGRYKLELPPGRYYIASGSVSTPTYYPSTRDVATARVVTVATGDTIQSIDFSSFVAAPRSPVGAALAALASLRGSGVLSGVIRYPDGTPAANSPVSVVPTSFFGSGAALNASGIPIRSSIADSAGRYRIENLAAATYYIAAGFADAPAFYPSASDVTGAQAIPVTPTTRIDTLDITVQPTPARTTVRGHVTTMSGAPAIGAGVRIQSPNPGSTIVLSYLPFRFPVFETMVMADGSFQLPNVAAGTYVIEALFAGVLNQQKTVVVADRPVTDLEFQLPIAAFSGRIVLEDGSPVPDPRAFQDAIVTSVGNPSLITSTILPVTPSGTFSRLLESGDFRFYLRVVPEEYEIRSIRWGENDLLKETLRMTGKEAVNVEVRVSSRLASPKASGTGVSGTAIDSVSGLPSVAERVSLCCLDAGPMERVSTLLRADGSFAFSDVRPGRYRAGLHVKSGEPGLFLVGGTIDVTEQGAHGVQLLSTPEFKELSLGFVSANQGPLPPELRPTVTFVSASGRARIVSERNQANTYVAMLPVGDRYTVVIENLPAGYVIKSGPTVLDVQRAGNTGGTPPLPLPTIITIGPE